MPNLSELKLNVTTKNMEVLTDKGERINTDLIICCTGVRINSSAYKSSFCQYTEICAHTHTPTDTHTDLHPLIHTEKCDHYASVCYFLLYICTNVVKKHLDPLLSIATP